MLLVLSLLALPALANELPDFTGLIAQNKDAVVSVNTTRKASGNPASRFGFPNDQDVPELFKRFFQQMPDEPSSPEAHAVGSGFMISPDGYIMTNAHVVADSDEVTVSLSDRRELPAKVVGVDEKTDVALLKINASNLPTVKLGNSDQLKVGQWVFAIGAPFGFEYSATQGVVSALSRSLPDGTYVPFIQTDVAVNPGNSGGPLFDLQGNVVGVNSQIYSRSGGYMGLSFAIPINVAKNVADQLKTEGHADHGWLGVMIQDMNQALAQSFGLDKPHGALVAQVTPNSPAQKAGLKAGDVILSYNGTELNRSNELPPLVGSTAAGSTASLGILRDGKEQTLKLTIGKLNEKSEKLAANDNGSGSSDEENALGLAVTDLNAEQRSDLGIQSGVLVTGMNPEGVAAEAGIRPQDVILSFNHQPVKNVSQLEKLIDHSPKGKPAAVQVMRKQQTLFVAIPIPEKMG